MRVCLLPTDTWGVGSYRVLFPGRELEKRGHEVFAHLDKMYLSKWSPHEGNVPLANSLDFKALTGKVARTWDADTYIFQRRMERLIPAAIRQLRRQGKRVVCELDDNYDLLPPGSPGQKVLREHADRLRVEWMNDGIGECDVLTVSTPALADYYARYSDNVTVLPNYLDWEMWRDVPLQYEIERPRVRVGWMGWLSWRGRDLEQLREWVRPWLLRHPEVDFVSVGERRGNAKAIRKAGHVTVHDYLDVPREQRVSVKTEPFRELAKLVATIDIGLVPLELNDFNECKSYLKGLEYAAAGIPCVATPTDQYRGFVRAGVDGFLAQDAEEWVRALEELVCDDGLRREMGRMARDKASQLTIQNGHWRQWERVWSGSTSAPDQTGNPDGSTSTTAKTTGSGPVAASTASLATT